jgi:hypothetical protein
MEPPEVGFRGLEMLIGACVALLKYQVVPPPTVGQQH